MTENDQIAVDIARKKSRKHYQEQFADNEDYQFSVHMLILAQVHHALLVHKLHYPDLVFEMKNVSAIILREMQVAGFVIDNVPPLDTR